MRGSCHHPANKLTIPRGDTVFQAGDEVLAVVHTSQIKQLAALLGPLKPS